MNTVLFRRDCKANYKLLLIFAAVLTMYGSMIVSMFDPSLGDSLQQMAASMPEIFAAFNMLDAGSTLIEFVANYLYGFLLIALPLVFIVLVSARLVSHYIDRGSMAYLLATPNRRVRIIATQAVALEVGIVCLVAYVTALLVGLSAVMFPGELDLPHLLLLSTGLLGLLTLFAGVCFCSSCLFNDAKYATGLGTGVCIAFVLLDMIANVGEKFEWLRFFTPVTLFDRGGLIAGDGAAVAKLAVLYAAGFALMAIGSAVFCRRDIPV